MDVTVAVVPRERLSALPASLRSLFATIPQDVPVVVIDGGANHWVRSELRQLQALRPFTHLESARFVLPNVARNQALDHVQTPFVAFCDNDLRYHAQWLQALVAHAKRHSAAAVSPITLQGYNEPQRILHAGGDLSMVANADGQSELRRHNRLRRMTLAEAEEVEFMQIPSEHDYFQYHCVLLETTALRETGGHDERLVLHEFLDSSLRLRAQGGLISFEPAARVVYDASLQLSKDDWPYFFYRWDTARASLSNQVLAENWGVLENSIYHERQIHRAVSAIVPRISTRLPQGRVTQAIGNRVNNALVRVYRRRLLKLDRKQRDGRVKELAPPASGSLGEVFRQRLQAWSMDVTGS